MAAQDRKQACAQPLHLLGWMPKRLRQCLCRMQGFRLLFYGDSITEYWMGTNRCQPWDKAKDA